MIGLNSSGSTIPLNLKLLWENSCWQINIGHTVKKLIRDSGGDQIAKWCFYSVNSRIFINHYVISSLLLLC
jgi:hypothetical protein